jgi:hypothetical protein
MLYRILGYGVLSLAAVSGLAIYRSSLVQHGYDNAVAEYVRVETVLKDKHKEDLRLLSLKNTELENENSKKKLEVSSYRSKFAAASERLRQQDANLSARVDEASRESLSRYAKAVNENFAGCRSHIERFGLEAASSAATAEALKKALDLANGSGWQGAE